MSRRSTSYLLNDPAIRRTEIERLHGQAAVLAEHEMLALSQLGLGEPRKILDIGCGSGAYLLPLASRFPSAEIMGIDRNLELLEVAKEAVPGAVLHHLDINDSSKIAAIVASFQPDAIFLRFVLQHLSSDEQKDLLLTILHSKPPSTVLFCIEPNDEEIGFHPANDSLLRLVRATTERQARRGGDRLLGANLDKLLKFTGFEKVSSIRKEMGSTTIGLELCREIYFPIWTRTSDPHTYPEFASDIASLNQWYSDACRSKESRLLLPVYVAAAR